MKIIRSFLIIAAVLGASTLVHAQQPQLKADPDKPVASTVPPPGSKPALAADAKPEVKTLKQSEQPAATKEEQVKAPQKPTVKLADDKVTTESLTAEQLKTLNGTAERPKQTEPLANDQNAKPLPLAAPAAPAVLKVKENK